MKTGNTPKIVKSSDVTRANPSTGNDQVNKIVHEIESLIARTNAKFRELKGLMQNSQIGGRT